MGIRLCAFPLKPLATPAAGSELSGRWGSLDAALVEHEWEHLHEC